MRVGLKNKELILTPVKKPLKMVNAISMDGYYCLTMANLQQATKMFCL